MNGIIKKHARQVIRNNPVHNPIRDAEGFYRETAPHFTNMKVFYLSKEDIKSICDQKRVEERFSSARLIRGTQRLHHFKDVPGSSTHLRVKAVSTLDDNHYKDVRLL